MVKCGRELQAIQLTKLRANRFCFVDAGARQDLYAESKIDLLKHLDMVIPLPARPNCPAGDHPDGLVAQCLVEVLRFLAMPGIERDQTATVLARDGLERVHQRGADTLSSHRASDEQSLD